jgi:hypothetical protein
MAKGYITWIGDGTACPLFQISRTLVPKLRNIKVGVEHRRRTDRILLPVVANGYLQAPMLSLWKTYLCLSTLNKIKILNCCDDDISQ